MTYLAVIQARLGSTRFPGKVLKTIAGRTMVKRVWDAAKASWANKVIVLWPERYPEMEENDLHGKFRRLIHEFTPAYVIRLTADCPLVEARHINEAIQQFNRFHLASGHYNNRLDGYDVQIFTPEYMEQHPHKENVIDDVPNVGGVSVNTPADLERVRYLAR